VALVMLSEFKGVVPACHTSKVELPKGSHCLGDAVVEASISRTLT
jgi:hypothetical protein